MCTHEKPVTIYGLASSLDGEIRYVGQTTKPISERLKEHRAHAKKYPHRHLSCWVNSVKSSGHEIIVVMLTSDAVWNETERSLIAELRNAGARLVNGTDGGEGRRSVEWTVEMRSRMSQKMSGVQKSAAHKQAISASLTGKRLSDSHRANVSRSLRGRVPSNITLLQAARKKAALLRKEAG